MGLNTILNEVIYSEQTSRNGDDKDETGDDEDDDKDYTKKLDTAIDYSDITELADEMTSMPPPQSYINTNVEGDDYDDIEDAIPVNKVTGDDTGKDDQQQQQHSISQSQQIDLTLQGDTNNGLSLNLAKRQHFIIIFFFRRKFIYR